MTELAERQIPGCPEHHEVERGNLVAAFRCGTLEGQHSAAELAGRTPVITTDAAAGCIRGRADSGASAFA